MKIVMSYPDPKSEKGISSYSENLIQNIKKQGLSIDESTFLQGKSFSMFRQLSYLLKYDIIHIQHEYNLLGGFGIPYFFILPILGRKKLIITMHTVLSQKEKFQGNKIKTLLRKLLYKFQNKFINAFSSKVIVHSEFFKKILIEEYGFHSDKVKVFHHAILENPPTENKNRSKKELDLSGNVYLLIGTMMPDHGHDVILKQADKIGKTILVATNPTAINYRNEDRIKNFLKLNQEIVKENNFKKFVRFDLGAIDNQKWWKYFSAADLILLPYRGGIGSGIFADAMAAKKPVIASNIPYFKEFVKNYDCLKIADTDEDFAKVIHNAMKPSEYKKMLKGCDKYFQENNLTAISKKYKKFYLSIN